MSAFAREAGGRPAAWVVVAIATLAWASVLGCVESNPQGPQKRTDAVTTKSAAPSAAPSLTGVTSATAKPPRDLCVGQEERDPPGELAIGRAVGEAKKPTKLAYGAGRWVWVNVWAAWCEPCKKEMPMLLEWRDKLRKDGVKLELVFVSIDDDERELDRFLESQPASGVRASYWLKSEEAQEKWFESVGFDDTPELPIHAFVSPNAKTACVVKGAVDKGDYTVIARMFRGGPG